MGKNWSLPLQNVPVPSGIIDFKLIKVHNWLNSSTGTLTLKADYN